MKRCRGQPFFGTERHNALATGLLAFDRLPPIPLPIRDPGLRHRLVLRMPVGKSCPGIQLTTARKAGDSLTFTPLQHYALASEGRGDIGKRKLRGL